MNNFYTVLAKCGHVGKNRYVLKWLFLRAEDGEEAAKLARAFPRVKHHHKDAIRYVERITVEEYYLGIKEMNNDPYFKVHSIQEQNRLCDMEDEIFWETRNNLKYKKKNTWQRLRYDAMCEECDKDIRLNLLNGNSIETSILI